MVRLLSVFLPWNVKGGAERISNRKHRDEAARGASLVPSCNPLETENEIRTVRGGRRLESCRRLTGQDALDYVSDLLALDVVVEGLDKVPATGAIITISNHPTGIAEIYLGEITGTKVELSTDLVARTPTAKEVTAGHRLYGLIGADLGWAYDMAAEGQPLQPHLSAQLKRTS